MDFGAAAACASAALLRAWDWDTTTFWYPKEVFEKEAGLGHIGSILEHFSPLCPVCFHLNIGRWLVARFGIVAIFPKLFWTHILFSGFHYCGKKVWETIFFDKKRPVIAERQTFFQKHLPNSNAKHFPRSRSLIKPLLKNSFPQFSKALDQERLHFTLAGLFAGFTIVASFARAKFKLQAFPKGANPLLNPY